MNNPTVIDFDRESILEEMVEQLFKKYMEKYDVFRDDILVFVTVISYPREYIVEIYDLFSTKVKYYTSKDISDALMWAEELLPWCTQGHPEPIIHFGDAVIIVRCCGKEKYIGKAAWRSGVHNLLQQVPEIIEKMERDLI